MSSKQHSGGICVKCGTCRAVCPVFSITGLEPLTARGKIALSEAIAEGKLKPDSELDKTFDLCIACGACAGVCPSSVDTLAVILKYRSDRFRHGTFEKSILSRANDPKKFTTLMKLGRASSALLFKRISKESGLRRRFPLPLIDADRILPPLADKFFLETRSGTIKGLNPSGPRTSFFVGCLNNYVYPDAAEETLRLLIQNSSEVSVHSEQGCCGLISLTAGDRKGAQSSALRNLMLFAGDNPPDALVTACPSCATTIIDRWPDLLKDHADATQVVTALAGRVLDLPQFLQIYQIEKEKDKPATAPIKIAYHDGCHARYGLKMIDEPRDALRRLPEFELVDQENPESCCGFGGTFNVKHPDYSTRLLQEKIASVVAAGADAIVTPCPGCRLWLTEGAARFAPGLKVYHIAQILAPQR
jgi:glycolate dehydrogenase iron-sulfur subunit